MQANGNPPTSKQKLQAFLLDWLIWSYVAASIIYFFRDQVSELSWSSWLYLSSLLVGCMLALVLEWLGTTIGERLLGVVPSPESGEQRPAWYTTQLGISALVIGVVTLVLGWQITEINLYYVFTRADNMRNMTERLARPYWPVFGTLIEKLIETIFLALMATAFAIPFSVLISFFAARNLMYHITAKWGKLLAIFLFAIGGIWLGIWLADLLSASLASDVFDVGLIRGILSLVFFVVGLIAGVFAGGRLSDWVVGTAKPMLARLYAGILGIILGVGAAFILATAVAMVVFGGSWSIFVRDVPIWPYVVLAVGAVVGAYYSLRLGVDAEFPIGQLIYTVVRFVLNATRSIEPFVWALVFVTWFRLGPFPGMVALMVHSVAALGKLYSEQIESIDPGPLEAIRATGGNELQVVAFGVIPQIIPPFISFTIYRWDINVRMSTIIGLVGGGGIGQMLFQYQNLAQWRKVSVAVILIVIVVMTLDNVSAKIRERIL